jgi:serine/threonine protein kinase
MEATPGSSRPEGDRASGAALAGPYVRRRFVTSRDGFDYYEGHDGVRDLPVSLKAVADSLSASATHELGLEHEFRVLSLLAHPAVQRVLDLDRDCCGRQHLILDANAGFSPLEALRGAELSELDVVQLADALLLALEYLHARGIAHSNLSPMSVLVADASQDDRITIRLTDFHGARHSPASRIRQWRAGAAFFLPPSGRSDGFPGSRADIFGVGALAAYLLAGSGASLDTARHTPLEVLKDQQATRDPRFLSILEQMVSGDDALWPRSALEVRDRMASLGLPVQPLTAASFRARASQSRRRVPWTRCAGAQRP